MNNTEETVTGEEHWTTKENLKLFLWEKYVTSPDNKKGTILFVHGSSMASTPTFDLQVPGMTDSSAMDVFARLGYVIDFIDWHWYDAYTWPTFNIADSAITVGVIIMVIEMLFSRKSSANEEQTPAQAKA